MKILFLTRVPSTAGAFILPLANKLRERGNIVELAFGPGDGLADIEKSGHPFTVLTMDKKSRSIGNFKVMSQLRQFIKDRQYDVVHTYTPVIGIYGRLAAYIAKTPIVIHSVIGSLLASGVPFSHKILFVTSEWLTSCLVDLFITLNDEDANAMVKYRLTSKNKIVSLKYEYGVDLDLFCPDNINKELFAEERKRLCLHDLIPVIGFVGRMVGAKGILDLFEAYKQIRAAGLRVKLLYIGGVLSTDKDKKTIEILKDNIKSSGYEEDVIFTGVQKNVPLYISLMDVVAHPTHHEGFPRIPVEAGAMGKPSVCTAVSGANVAIENGKTGYIVPIKDPKRMAEALLEIIGNPVLAQRMGNAAKTRVVELFDQKKIVDQQIRIYEEFFRRTKKQYNI